MQPPRRSALRASAAMFGFAVVLMGALAAIYLVDDPDAAHALWERAEGAYEDFTGATPRVPIPTIAMPAATPIPPAVYLTGTPHPLGWPLLVAADIEAIIAQRTIEAREQISYTPLRLNAKISDVARAHSEDMAANGYLHFLHGAGPIERGMAAGFKCGFGENIHKYPQKLGLEVLDTNEMGEQIMADWLSSPGHRINIMDKSPHALGVGVYVDEDGYWGGVRTPVVYATQNFYAC